MRKLILIIFSVITFTSCEQVVEVDMPEYEPVLVVNSIFESDSIPVLDVLYSRSILDSATIKRLSTSKVELFENDVLVGLMVPDNNKHYYMPGYTMKEGKKYTVRVNQAGFKEISAGSQCPLGASVLNHTISGGAGKNINNETLAKASITFKDLPDENFYFISIVESMMDTFYIDSVNYFVNNSSYPVTLYDQGNGGEENYINSGYLLSDEFFNGKDHTVNLYFSEYHYMDSTNHLTLYFSTVSREYYRYFKTLFLQQISSGNPFSEPVRVYSNINNGLGIFGGASTKKIILK